MCLMMLLIAAMGRCQTELKSLYMDIRSKENRYSELGVNYSFISSVFFKTNNLCY